MADPATSPGVSAVERAADQLRRAIFAGELAPGAPLREIALSGQLGIGRSTVREALALLVADGVATRVAHRGVSVKQLSARDLADVSLARIALETAGVRRWHRATAEEQDAVRAAYAGYVELAARTHDPAQLTKAHLRIHRALVGLTGSSRLVSAADAYSAELRLGLAHLDRVRGNVAEQVQSHRVLLDLLEGGDVDAAAAELDHHLEAAEVSLRSAIRHDTI